MIQIKVVVKGEPDMPPFTRVFQYRDKSDEEIFYNSIQMVKEKLTKNLKININESLLVYCAYVVSELRAHRSVSAIERVAPKVLSSDKVLIGVPETLQRIKFEVIVDKLPKKIIVFEKPLQTSSYILAQTR